MYLPGSENVTHCCENIYGFSRSPKCFPSASTGSILCGSHFRLRSLSLMRSEVKPEGSGIENAWSSKDSSFTHALMPFKMRSNF